MVRSKPQAGEIYTHFKGKQYEIVAVAAHSETMEELVIYRALYGEYSVFARPLDMFLSRVDLQKYPDVNQKYRFEMCGSSAPEEEGSEETSLLLSFLDLRKNEERLEFLQLHRAELDDVFLSAVAESLDYVESETDSDLRYHGLMQYLATLIKYESGRMR